MRWLQALYPLQQGAAIDFKEWLETAKNKLTGKPLSLATIGSTLRAVRDFFHWLATHPSVKRSAGRNDWRYFKQALKDARAAQASTPRPVPSVEHVRRAFAAMPSRTSHEKRDRALTALLILTGACIGAVVSLRVKHIDIDRREVIQNPRDMNTKHAKNMITTFFPIGEDYVDALQDYLRHLVDDLMFGPEDAAFPKADVTHGPNGYQVAGLSRHPFATRGPLNAIIKDAFSAVQLPRHTPHSFCHMLALHGDKICSTREAFKAWSQNLELSNAMTTVTSYMPVSEVAQRELILGLGK